MTTVAEAHEIQPPKPGAQPEAKWPGEAGEQDVVVPVLLKVGADGVVVEAQVEVSLGEALDREALAVARRWRFEPARREGVAIEAKVRAFVRFVGQTRHQHAHGHEKGSGGQEGHEHPHTHRNDEGRGGDTAVQVVGHGEAEHQAPREVRVQGERTLPGGASTTTRDRAVLRAAPHRTAGDLLRVVPGVNITQHSGEGKAYQIFFRGFDAVHGQDLELWAGGAPVNDVSNLHGQGYADLHFLMPEIIREIQSTPGVYDPRQGDFAVAGTMRLALGLDEPGVIAKVSAGNFGARRYFLAYHPRDAREETFAAFEIYGTDGFGPSRAAQRVSGVAQALHEINERTTARVLVTHYTGRFASAGVVRRDDIEAGRIDAFGTYDPQQGGDSSRSQLVVELVSQGEHDRWTLAPFVVRRGLRLRSNFTGFLDDEAGDGVQQLNDATTAGLTASYRRAWPLLSPRDLFEAGLYARSDWIDQSQRRIETGSDRIRQVEVDAQVRAMNVAGYLDTALYPWKRLALRGGVRLDGLGYTTLDAGGQARSAQGAHLGTRATAEVILGAGISAAISHGEGFRSPQARSLAEGQKTPFTTVTSHEAGLRYRDGSLRGSAAIFRTALSDDLAFDQARARNERTPPTLRQGAAVEVTAQPSPRFTSSISLTYTRASFRRTEGEYLAGALLPYVPQLVGRTDLSYEPTLGQVLGRTIRGQLGAGMSFYHRRPLPFGEWGRDAFLLDLRAGLQVANVRLGFDAFNSLDSRWFDGEFVYASRFNRGGAASLVPARHVTLGPPRTYLLSLQVNL
ncbi:MAG: TonB-dependent receptor [Polyangiaceae bacterium]|nr:TonB-dependent receptor [Polyangiaceae bacterium]